MEIFKNILLINYGGIGDEILFLPTISSIKKTYPNSKITLALEARSKSVKNLTNMIDEVICVDIKANGYKKYLNMLKFIMATWTKKFDIVISSGKNPLVALILFLTGIKERIGYNSKLGFLLTKKVELNENQYAGLMYHDLVKQVINCEYENPNIEIIGEFESIKEEKYIAIHPGVSKMSISKGIFKCPNYDFWKNLIFGILNKDFPVVLLGTNDDKDLIEEILKEEKIVNHPKFLNYFNKTKNIMEMAFIMKNAYKVICVDSAPLHVAISVKANTIAIFGPTNDVKLVPKIDNVKLITNNVSCRPCLWHKRMKNCESSECLNIDFCQVLNEIN